ncbi:MAG: Lrp/AsnC ligand binding domain-containing protein [Candidatus Kariarchaeaceae archaeon]
MSSETIKTRKAKSSLSKRLLFYGLALSSSILYAIFVVLDGYISREILPDGYVFATISWWLGLAIFTILVLILALPLRTLTTTSEFREKVKSRAPLGTYLDPNFRGLHIPPWEVLKFVLLGGVFMGISTIIYFQMIDKFDASTFVPLMSFVIVYLLIGDFLTEKDGPTLVEIQAIIMITLGVFISSASKSEFDLQSLVITLVFLNGTSAGITICHKKATQWKDPVTRRSLDSLAIRYYSMSVATIITTLMFLVIITEERVEMLKNQFIASIIPVGLSMLLATISYILFIRALEMGKMSIVNSLTSFSVIASIPIAFIAYWIFPKEFPLDMGGSLGIVLKSIAAILVLTGMISLALSDVKILVLVKVSEDGLKEIEKIAAMKGVARVSALAGKYDMLITIRTRSIGKGYRNTIRKISAVPKVSSLTTMAILKEWN